MYLQQHADVVRSRVELRHRERGVRGPPRRRSRRFLCLRTCASRVRVGAELSLRERLRALPFKIAYECYLDDNWEIFLIDADGSHVANGTSRYGRTIQRKRQRPLNLAKPSKVSQAIVFDDKDIDVLSLTNVCSLFSY